MAPIDAKKDYYAILEIAIGADSKSIKTSYKRLALLRHPDRNRGVNATKDFQLLQEAYSTLSDPDTRRQYDQTYTPRKTKPTSSTCRTPQPAQQGNWESLRLARRRGLEEKRSRLWEERVRQSNQIWEETRAVRRMQDDIERIKKEYLQVKKEEEDEKGLQGYWNWIWGSKVASAEQKLERDRRQLDRTNALRIKYLQLQMKKGSLSTLENILFELDQDVDRLRGEIEAIDREIEREREIKRQAEEAERRRKAELERRKLAEELVRRKREEVEELARKRQEEAELAWKRRAEERRRAEELTRNMNSYFEKMEQEDESDTGCTHDMWWTRMNGFGQCSRCHRIMRRFYFRCPGCQEIACASCRDEMKRPQPEFYWDWD